MMLVRHLVRAHYWSLVCSSEHFQQKTFLITILNLLPQKVPNEEAKSPTFKTFPQSITIAQGQTAVFTCETDKAPTRGSFYLYSVEIKKFTNVIPFFDT